MNRILILLALASCNLLSLDDEGIKINMAPKQASAQPSKNAKETKINSSETAGVEKVNRVVGIPNKEEGQNSEEKPTVIELSSVQPPRITPISQQEQEAQEKINQLWIQNLRSRENYFVYMEGLRDRTRFQEIDIKEDGSFEIQYITRGIDNVPNFYTVLYYHLIKVVSDSQAEYNVDIERKTMNRVVQMRAKRDTVLTIKPSDPSQFSGDIIGVSNIDEYKEQIEETYEFGGYGTLLYRRVPDEE
ncbi:hypothetical protein SAMN02745150_01486 [Brevinema andersonii]|uniref:Uncharacterized protein n=1 Tax=Brevinema andersonii TaxID=34097 RepID=A0A1I1FM93_BREAD|nr:hypothetical protein [Brevinema andersonii]SFB98233.1 hypothetical protein SAMN02745150_01486 [Brevinema andersonii]